jgi:phage terminase small subunit
MANGFNAQDAYYTVFGNTTNKKPSYPYVLLKKPEVAEYIQARREEMYNSLNIDAIRVMQEIAKIAFENVEDKSLLTSKLKALELLSKNLSLQTQKTENKDIIEVQLVED